MEIKQSSKYLVVGVQIFICGDISAWMLMRKKTGDGNSDCIARVRMLCWVLQDDQR